MSNSDNGPAPMNSVLLTAVVASSIDRAMEAARTVTMYGFNMRLIPIYAEDEPWNTNPMPETEWGSPVRYDRHAEYHAPRSTTLRPIELSYYFDVKSLFDYMQNLGIELAWHLDNFSSKNFYYIVADIDPAMIDQFRLYHGTDDTSIARLAA